MFADICFPENNENVFSDTAALFHSKLYFAYKDKKDSSRYVLRVGSSLYNVALFDRMPSPTDKKERRIYTLDREFLYSKITQVTVKDIAASGCLVGLPLSMVLAEKNKEKIIGRLFFVLRLFQKYKVNAFAASYAKTRYGLKDGKDIASVLGLLGVSQKNVPAYSSALWKFIEEQNL